MLRLDVEARHNFHLLDLNSVDVPFKQSYY